MTLQNSLPTGKSQLLSGPHAFSPPRSLRLTSISELPLVYRKSPRDDRGHPDSGRGGLLADLRVDQGSVLARPDWARRGGSVSGIRLVCWARGGHCGATSDISGLPRCLGGLLAHTSW